MDAYLREAFNTSDPNTLFAEYREWLYSRLGGPFPFRLAETPLFLTQRLREHLQNASIEIAAQLSRPATLAQLKKAIPPRYAVPGMDASPHCVQVDFALVRGDSGEIEGRVVELQAFPSLYALESLEADAWGEVLRTRSGLEGDWTCFFGEDREHAMSLMRRCILGSHNADAVALVDLEPHKQKTVPDFTATKRLFDVDSVCVTEIEKEGRRLFRRKDGKRIRIERIYNRMVFDELEVKNVKVPFAWNEELDVSWCSHPNWYWAWSKYSLPHLDHPTVPRARYLSDFYEGGAALPEDFDAYVLKPLFSFAGAGVIVDVTREAVDAVPAERRHDYLLQRKVEYAWTIRMPGINEGDTLGARNAVKAEVRVMLMRGHDGEPLEALLPLVRLSRGKMLGVDQNKSAETLWTGGTVGVWVRGR